VVDGTQQTLHPECVPILPGRDIHIPTTMVRRHILTGSVMRVLIGTAPFLVLPLTDNPAQLSIELEHVHRVGTLCHDAPSNCFSWKLSSRKTYSREHLIHALFSAALGSPLPIGLAMYFELKLYSFPQLFIRIRAPPVCSLLLKYSRRK
jgi:hypothetical protein